MTPADRMPPLPASAPPTIAQAAGSATRFTDHAVPDPGVRALFTTSRRWQAWLDVEAALARAEAKLGMVPVDAAEAITQAARIELIDVAAVADGIARTSHPLVPLVAELARAAGESAGEFVHWGATTQNITQTGNNLLIREANALLEGLLDRCLRAAAELAEREAETPMAGRTHGQHAVPITFGFKAAAWLDELCRDRERLTRAGAAMGTAMVGGAVGSFASLGAEGPAVQKLLARDLGLTPMAVPSRAVLDGFADHLWALAMAATTSAKIARDVMSLMQTEIAEVAEPAGEGSVGSSTMPQKQNPKLTYDVIELCARIRGCVPIGLEARIHPSEADGSATALMDELVVDAIVWSGDLLVRLALILEGLSVDRARMRQNLALSAGLISAEALMLELARHIGRQSAHELVFELSRQALREQAPLRDVARRDPRVTRWLTVEEIDQTLAPMGHLGQSAAIARRAANAARTTPNP